MWSVTLFIPEVASAIVDFRSTLVSDFRCTFDFLPTVKTGDFLGVYSVSRFLKPAIFHLLSNLNNFPPTKPMGRLAKLSNPKPSKSTSIYRRHPQR